MQRPQPIALATMLVLALSVLLSAVSGAAAAAPDLIVTSVTDPPTTALPKDSFTVTATVKNQGTADAGASSTRFFLVSPDGTTVKNLKGLQAIDALAPGASESPAATVAVYSDTVPGTYFLVACADGLKVVTESNETNNCRSSTGKITVLQTPDLVITAIDDPPATASQGQGITVKSTVKNIGSASSTATTTRYFLVPTSGTGRKDLKGLQDVPALDPGQTFTDQETATIRKDTVPGDYFLQACADSGKTVIETNEGNNCLTSADTIKVTAVPDLVVTALSVVGNPVTVGLGGSITFNFTVANQGAGDAGSSLMRFFLVNSSGGTKDLRGHPGVPGLRSGESKALQGTVTVFTDTAPGSYTGVRACADYNKAVLESNENNNCLSVPANVTVTSP